LEVSNRIGRQLLYVFVITITTVVVALRRVGWQKRRKDIPEVECISHVTRAGDNTSQSLSIEMNWAMSLGWQSRNMTLTN